MEKSFDHRAPFYLNWARTLYGALFASAISRCHKLRSAHGLRNIFYFSASFFKIDYTLFA
jgi:hypothetical protein